MSRDVNRVVLKGNVGREPELRYLDGGTKLAKFSVATKQRYRGSDGVQQEETEWHNVEAFGVIAERVEALEITRGTRVLIEGRLKTDSWMKGESKAYFTRVIITEVEVLATIAREETAGSSATVDA
jgi:single-strand DNA-binding protein